MTRTGLVVIAALTCALALFGAPAAFAATITVNTTSDTHCTGFAGQSGPNCSAVTDSGGHISLRSALEYASTQGSSTTIDLPPGTYNLSLGDLMAGTQANTSIDIAGQGTPANTTIHQTVTGRQVFDVNFNVNANVVFRLDNVTVSGGSENELDPDGFGGNGGAILAGGSSSAGGNAVTLTNDVFSGNYCSPSTNAGCTGGAISMTGGGNLTITNSTFSGNTASKSRGFGGGGAIYFDNGANGGNVSITNSTFTNNTAQGNPTTGGVGGAVFLAGGTGTTYTVTTNTFTGNAAVGTGGAHGGAIYKPSGTLNASFNRIVGNTSDGDASGLYVGNNAGSVGNATNNWWGCNGGPSAAPCDTAVLGTPNQGGSMTITPWIVLTNTASPNPVRVNQTTTLTADFLHNSSGGSLTAAQASTLIGLPVTWGNASRGSLSGSQTSIQSTGTATSTFTANAAGAGQADATVDSGQATASVTINKADTTTAITSESPDPSVTGQSVSVGFHVTSATGGSPTAPSGSVTVSDGVASCTGSIDGNGDGSCNVAFASAGSKSLTATYAGDVNFNTSTSSPATPHTVNKADTTTSISADSPDPSVVGQTVTVHYGVTVNSPGAGSPTGNVTVSDGTQSCTGTVAAGQCSLTFTNAGATSLAATYAGDANFNGSASGPEAHTVDPADTTTSITSDNPDPSAIGQAVTVNYSVTAVTPGGGAPTGSVTVSDGVDSCTGTAAAGTCDITLTTGGSRTLTASYAGDSNFNSSASAGEPHIVNKAATTTSIASDSPDPSVVGQSVTVHYSVSPSSGSGTPTGNVTVSDGVIFCTGTVAAGQCTLTFTSAGARTLTASYAGDATFNGSVSVSEPHGVNPADTTTSITSASPSPSVVGQSVTISFSVAATAPGAGTPTGNVVVSDGTQSCTALATDGQCTIAFASAGTKSLTAAYAGDSNFSGSTSSSADQTVNAANTTTAITSDTPDPSTVGQAVTVNYTVAPAAPGAGTPTGTVTVSDGADSCTATVAAGACDITLNNAGSRTLTASYAGDSNFNSSASAGEPHTVNKLDTTTTITSDNPDPSTAGQPVSVQYSVSASAGTATGNVTVSDGVNSCIGTVAAGACNITLTTLGARTLTATYGGDSNFNSSASVGEAHTVNGIADLTVVKTDDVSGQSQLGSHWTWRLHVTNGGTADATFGAGQTVLVDDLPSAHLAYGAVTVSGQTGIGGAGNMTCAIASNSLTCSAQGGAVAIGPSSGAFDVTFTATPAASGVYANPRSGGTCQVDPSNLVTESSEVNNGCSDTVTVPPQVGGGGLTTTTTTTTSTSTSTSTTTSVTTSTTSTNTSTTSTSTTSSSTATRPTITLTAPRNGAVYTQRQVVRAHYSCQAPPGAGGITSCTGTVRDGARLDTATTGDHTFTVTATSGDGQRTTRTIHYTVLPRSGFALGPMTIGRGGALRVQIMVGGPGDVDVLASGPGNHATGARVRLQPAKGRFAYARAHRHVTRASLLRLTLTPGARGKRLLGRHHAVALNLTVAFTPTHGATRTKTLHGVTVRP